MPGDPPEKFLNAPCRSIPGFHPESLIHSLIGMRASFFDVSCLIDSIHSLPDPAKVMSMVMSFLDTLQRGDHLKII